MSVTCYEVGPFVVTIEPSGVVSIQKKGVDGIEAVLYFAETTLRELPPGDSYAALRAIREATTRVISGAVPAGKL